MNTLSKITLAVFASLLLLTVASCTASDLDDASSTTATTSSTVQTPPQNATTQTSATTSTTLSNLTESIVTDSIVSPDPPGTLRDPNSIPQANQSDVGKTVSLFIGDKTFDYFYDTESKKERLLVLESVDIYQNIGKITIYETTLSGLDGLLNALKTPIDAKILAVSNISWEEVYYSRRSMETLQASISGGRFSADEIIDLASPVQNPHTSQWYSSVQTSSFDDDNNPVVALMSNLTDDPSIVLSNRFDRINSIIERFALAEYL